MKALLVTSRVTFVPSNYDELVVGMASCPQIAGLLVLDNADGALVLRALGLVITGGRRIGRIVLANLVGSSGRRRKRAYAGEGKPVFRASSINSREVAELVRARGFDLLVNARTRHVYRKRILRTPRLGCINVHHGLLPDQRGTMCDLWSLSERRPAGFSIHVMEHAIDTGPILADVRVSNGRDRNYPAYLARSARVEVAVLRDVLARIEANDAVHGRPNFGTDGLVVRRTPTRRQVRTMKRMGMRI